MPATAATVIPQIGSTASSPTAAARGARARRLGPAAPHRPVRRTSTTFARIDSAISPGVRDADLDPRGHVDPVEQLVGHAVAAQLVEHAVAALGAGDEADVGQPRLEPAAQRVQLVAPVRGDDQREVARPGARGRRRPTATISSSSSAPMPQQRRGDRRVAHHQHPRRRQRRLEEDLDRAARQAGVLDRDRAVLDGDVPPSAPMLLAVGKDPQQHRLAAVERDQRVGAHALLGADAADEAVDRAVGEDERDAPGLDAGRALRADHGRGHERDRRAAASSCDRRASAAGIIAAARGVPASPPRRAPGCRACRCGRPRGSRAARRSPR